MCTEEEFMQNWMPIVDNDNFQLNVIMDDDSNNNSYDNIHDNISPSDSQKQMQNPFQDPTTMKQIQGFAKNLWTQVHFILTKSLGADPKKHKQCYLPVNILRQIKIYCNNDEDVENDDISSTDDISTNNNNNNDISTNNDTIIHPLEILHKICLAREEMRPMPGNDRVANMFYEGGTLILFSALCVLLSPRNLLTPGGGPFGCFPELASRKRFDRLLKKIVNIYQTSRIDPGESVGAIAAQSIGEPTTQMT